MKDYIEERVLEFAGFIIERKATIRACASIFGASKSTVHKDVTERLQGIKPELLPMVRCVLEENKAERHIRGGAATRAKYNKRNKSGDMCEMCNICNEAITYIK